VTPADRLAVLSAGAAKAVVLTVAGDLGIAVDAAFDAAGTIRELFITGARCDVVILPAPMQQTLAMQRLVDADSLAPLGRVRTGIAVRSGEPLPAIADAAALRDSLGRASALYVPDVERSTAGIHFIRMLRTLGIDDAVRDRVRAFANGAQAMAAMAAAPAGTGAIGCTQVTEILYTGGVVLAGLLPPPFELDTVYTLAVSRHAPNRGLAQRFAARLVGIQTSELRAAGGFAPD
jgi:molybdate transport system substrate-binding protein